MARSEQRMLIAATVALATICLPALAATSAAAAGAPPFCVARGGAGEAGGLSPQICAYHDYQQCLHAAAQFPGNCVQNIDYPGEVSTGMTLSRARRRH